MRKNFRRLLGIFTVIAIIFAAVCVNTETNAAKKIGFKKTSITMQVGKKANNPLNNVPKNGKVTYSSQNKKIASVTKKGVIKAVKVGKTKIVAKYKSKKYTCKVNVVAATVTPTIEPTKEPEQIEVTICPPATQPPASSVAPEQNGKTLDVHFIDVGQADCIFLQEKEQNKTIANYLIDAGNEADDDTIIDYLKLYNVSTLDGFFISHWHEDHCGAARYIPGNFTVKKAYIRPNVNNVTSKCYTKTIEALQTNNVEMVYPNVGDVISENDLTFQIVGPVTTIKKDENANSLAFVLTFGDKRFYFGGDAPQENEEETLKSGADISNIDVYKVSHHGSSYSTSYSFLREMMERKSADLLTRPFYAIICCQTGNSYGHPHAQTMERLEQAGAIIHRTDKEGHIVVTTDGNNISITTQKATSPQMSPVPTTSPTQAPEKGMYVGNVTTKMLHKSTCSKLPAEKNRVYFDTLEEAEAAGYTKHCTVCFKESTGLMKLFEMIYHFGE